jgi:hypothetical protein
MRVKSSRDTAGREDVGLRRLHTPRAAALAGVFFALLFSTSLLMLQSAVPPDVSAETTWVEDGADQITVAVALMPFAGIAFLWFVGVVRDQMGRLEDRFFSSVFFGSSLLFLAMVFVAMAILGGILATVRADGGSTYEGEVVRFGQALTLQISSVYGLKMAAVVMVSVGTIWLRTGLMPRWLVAFTYVLALALLVIVTNSAYLLLVFPGWVLGVSVLIWLTMPSEPDEAD